MKNMYSFEKTNVYMNSSGILFSYFILPVCIFFSLFSCGKKQQEDLPVPPLVQNIPLPTKKQTKVNFTFTDEMLRRCTGKTICENETIQRTKEDIVSVTFRTEHMEGDITIYEKNAGGKQLVTTPINKNYGLQGVLITSFSDGIYYCEIKRGEIISKVGFALVTKTVE